MNDCRKHFDRNPTCENIDCSQRNTINQSMFITFSNPQDFPRKKGFVGPEPLVYIYIQQQSKGRGSICPRVTPSTQGHHTRAAQSKTGRRRHSRANNHNVKNCAKCAKLCKMCKIVQNCAKSAKSCKMCKKLQNVQNCAKCAELCKIVQNCAKCAELCKIVQNCAKCAKFRKMCKIVFDLHT